jgi:membrane-associated phospholipid phosphatase
VTPLAGSWKPWVLTSGDEFRPAPPPAYDSAQEATEMAEVKNFARTPISNSLANFWQFGAGGTRIYWFWNDVLSQDIMAAGWNDNAPKAARAYALTSIASYDAYVACWDAKYFYLAMRPFQIDPTFTPLFTTPNHPSYPSGHSTLSNAIGGVLNYLFPADSADVKALVHEAGEARIWAGIHFRSDIIAGEAVGGNVADAVIAHANGDGSNGA